MRWWRLLWVWLTRCNLCRWLELSFPAPVAHPQISDAVGCILSDKNVELLRYGTMDVQVDGDNGEVSKVNKLVRRKMR